MQFLLSAISLIFFASTLSVSVQAAPIKNRLHIRDSLTGDGTFYTVGGSSCGGDYSNDDLVAAISIEWMGSGPKSSYCGKSINVKSEHGSVTLKIVDTCPGCKRGDVDMSRAAFQKIAKLNDGRIPISWSI
ncbi:RlpA-like double-psi beta-barrel-protein domain-containing protein-containing protein [Parasitella parasitica]|nr:RlpA-like double-psi beta-barrel-protein domain-containing protein-containing protein [Parasitella parasitica]